MTVPRNPAPAIQSSPGWTLLAAYAVGVGLATVSLLLGKSAERYGWVLFLLAPVVATFVAVGVLSRRGRVTNGDAAAHSLVITLLSFGVFVAADLEGRGCATIALPIVLVPAILGGIVGRLVFRRGPTRIAYGIGIAPLLLLGSDLAKPLPADRSVTTSIVIAAAPDRVWANVIRFPAIAKFQPGDATPWTFALGYPQPLRCDLEGEGVGSLRRCIFDEGVFAERVSVWDPGRDLTFEVEDQPSRIDGYLAVTRGRFLLTRLADGSTRIDGTTWYRGLCAPHWYFEWWCEQMLHDIHRRVLDHVKALSERG